MCQKGVPGCGLCFSCEVIWTATRALGACGLQCYASTLFCAVGASDDGPAMAAKAYWKVLSTS